MNPLAIELDEVTDADLRGMTRRERQGVLDLLRLVHFDLGRSGDATLTKRWMAGKRLEMILPERVCVAVYARRGSPNPPSLPSYGGHAVERRSVVTPGPFVSAVLKVVAQINEEYGAASECSIHSRLRKSAAAVKRSISHAVEMGCLERIDGVEGVEFYITEAGGDLLAKERRHV
jgi:hypothetical protein